VRKRKRKKRLPPLCKEKAAVKNREIVAVTSAEVASVRGIVDRFEGDYAIVEIAGAEESGADRFIQVLRITLEKETREGDAVLKDAFGWHTQKQETEDLKKEIQTLMDDLFVE